MATTIHLTNALFQPQEALLIETSTLTASTFRYPSGVAALRLSNDQGELILLPFQGQQIWSATLGGRNITMKSMFEQPNDTRDYLETYGAFAIHCGATAMGVPMGEDTHPLHGELPNAPYQNAWIVVGEDEGGEYIALGGEYKHTIAFSFNYVAHPVVKLYAGSDRCSIKMTVTNLKQTPMEFMYMAHVNFRPVDQGTLVYSAPCTAESTRLRKSIPSHVQPTAEYLAFLKALEADPAQHNVLRPELSFDPEVVISFDYQADSDGWAHTMQVHPNGTADYIRHKPAQLDKGVRWICRTPDQDALGMVLPATAEPEGYHAEKEKGNLKVIEGGESFSSEMEVGVLSAEEAEAMADRIAEILG